MFNLLVVTAAAGALMLMAAAALGAETVFVEAEGFEKPGGWALDPQFMDQMGSPYLLAHGLGVPVEDATTTVRFPAPGTYRVFVRTKDWAANVGPGKFQLIVDGRALAATFGTVGDGRWLWQDGGTVEVARTDVRLALHDLTGFDGRCDAVLFVKDAPAGFAPPADANELAAFRRKALGLPDTPKDVGRFDLVVVGGGYAGLCAAVAAARMDLAVALIQDRPVLGGNASSEVRVNPVGRLDVGPFPRNADIVKELRPWKNGQPPDAELFRWDDSRALGIVQAEKNVALFLSTRAFAVEKAGDRIAAVVAKNVRTGEEMKFRAPLFADCTGDGTIGYLAGADWRMGREGRRETGESFAPPTADRRVLGASNYWSATRTDGPTAFPECPWALRVTEESYPLPPPKYPPKLAPGVLLAGGWNWESGFGRDMIADAEAIRDHNLRAVFGTWDFLKNRSTERAQYADARLAWVAYLLGKRESRRLLGDHILTEQDIREKRDYPDACVTATWYFDMHYPHPENAKYFPGQEFRSIAYDDPNFEKYRGQTPGRYTPIEPCAIPWRCFYSRNVPNLMMAGRDVSATHVGLAPVRVMHTTGMMGTVVGRAAYLCRKFTCDPRALYEKHLDEFKSLLANPDARRP